MSAVHPTTTAPAAPYIRLMRDRELLESVLAQFKRLYVRLRRRWIEQTPEGTYLHHEVTDQAGRQRGWLHDHILREHLLGRRTVGVFHGGTTSVFSFDLDFQTNDEVIRVNLTRGFVQWLEELLGPECCHVWETGSKGYRVEVFLTEPVTWARLSAFFALVLDTPWYDDAPADQRYTWRKSPFLHIETRPESPAGGRGVKLPLCVDRRNGRFCTFLDPHTLEPVPDPYDYLLNIKPMHPSRLPLAGPRPQPHSDLFAGSDLHDHRADEADMLCRGLPAEQLLAKCERLWHEGLQARGTRHAALLLLARWHRWRKPDIQLAELESLLLRWTDREFRLRRHLIAHDYRHCVRDAKSVALSAIRGRYSLAPYLDRTPCLTHQDVEALRSIRSADQRLVFLALLLHRSLYAGPTGEFFMSYAQVADLLGWTLPGPSPDTPLPDKARVGRAIRSLLRRHAHLIAKVKPADQPRRLATHYRILLPLPAHVPAETVYRWPARLTSGSVTLDQLATLLPPAGASTHHPSPNTTCHPLASLSPLPPSPSAAPCQPAAPDPALSSVRDKDASPLEEVEEAGGLASAAALSPRSPAVSRREPLLRPATARSLCRAHGEHSAARIVAPVPSCCRVGLRGVAVVRPPPLAST